MKWRGGSWNISSKKIMTFLSVMIDTMATNDLGPVSI